MNNPFNPFGNDIFNPQAAKKALDEMKRQNDKVLQHKFSGKIKGNFLISIKDRVVKLLGNDINKYFDLRISHEKMVDNSLESFEYEICRHIVGVHRSNLVFETTEVRKKLEGSVEYQEDLAQKVLKQIKLRYYGGVYFRQHSIMQGDNFIFFPVPYYLFVLCIKMLGILSSDKAVKDLPCYRSFSTVVNKGLAALSLLEDNFLDNAYPICRGVIEMYIKLLVLINKSEAIPQFEAFTGYELQKSCTTQTYADEFNNLYNARVNQSSRDKIDFLHYGWVDIVDDYHENVKSKPYSITGLIEYLRTLYDDDQQFFLDNLEVLFKMCHGYTHGSVGNAVYPILHYFEISMMLYGTLSHTYKILCEMLDLNETIDGIDVLEELEEGYTKIETQHANRTTENFDYYYKNQFKI